MMAARAASAAGFCFLKIDRQMPGAKGNGIANVLRIVGGVRIVASPAGSSLVSLVDMDEMEILVAVAKTGQSGGILLFGDGFFMAHETELIVARLVRCIKKLREIFPQHPEVI